MTALPPECARVRDRLSGYLDGDLDGDRGTLVRGHLRECADCRKVSVDEAALRDGLRALAPVDPPATLWAGVQARLAAAEVAEAKRPTWRRILSHWRMVWLANTRPIMAFGAVAVAAVALLWWRAHPSATTPSESIAVNPVPAHVAPAAVDKALPVAPEGDVTADLAAEPARIASTYESEANELLVLVETARTGWTELQRTAYDGKLAALRMEIANAPDARALRKGWRALIRYVQTAVARDEVAMANTRGAP